MSRQSWLAAALVAPFLPAALAQTPGSIQQVGNTLVSAMMVRVYFYFFFNQPRVCSFFTQRVSADVRR